ncbi:MAG: molybdopterin-binding protein, partial [Thermoleophilia bacterium]
MCEPDQKTVAVQDAVGLVLSHDITEVNARTHYKGSAFRRGHVITEADVSRLLDLGKENIYVLEMTAEQMHEDDAVLELVTALAGDNASFMPEPREGRINLIAGVTGLLK